MKLLNDHSNLRNIIDEMKHDGSLREITLDEKLQFQLALLDTQQKLGYPYQDILVDSEDSRPIGIPVTLANIVLDICKFCAMHNIDLVEAMEQAA